MTEYSVMAYLAGFFDGEGHIAIVRRRANDARKEGRSYLRYHLWISVSQTTLAPLDLFQATFGGSIREVRGRRSYGRGTYHRWDWIATTQQATTALQLMRPYLIVKAKESDIALEFQGTVNRKTGRSPHPPAVIAKREELWLAIREARKQARVA